MQIERLSLLAEVLESQKLVANVSFHLSTWLDADTRSPVTAERVSAGTGTDNFAVVDASKLSCGTVACAVGHAALIPEFQALGLKMVRDADAEPGDVGALPSFDGFVSWAAVNRFFDLPDLLSEYLFMASRYDSPQPGDVAARIREVISEYPNAVADA